MTPHTGIRATTLAIAGVGTAVVGWLVLRLVASGGGLPEPGWVGLAAILFLGGGLLAAGWQVRKLRDGERVPHVTPLRAARTLVLGQAGALTGAVLVGWYLANVLVLLPDADVESQRARIWPFIAHAVAALLLSGAGMLVQRWCRVRPRDDDEDENPPGPPAPA